MRRNLRPPAIAATLALSAGLYWQFQHGNPRSGESQPAPETAATSMETTTVSEPESLPSAPAAPFFVADGSSRTSLVIALDEAVTRDADGKETVVRLDPPATAETLRARLAALTAVGGVFPVAYPENTVRTETSRRIITRDLRVKADGNNVDALLASRKLTVKDRPAYAPDWLVVSAADPLAAVAAMDSLRAAPQIASADVLVAVQHSLRTMPNDPLIGDQWHLKNTNSTRTHANLETAWNYGGTGGVKGTGIRIGIVDDGLETAHPDLVTNVDTVNDKDWNGNDSDPNPGSADDHGTSCAGNAAARGNNSLGVSGTAPEATLVGMRLIAASVTDAQEAEAMAYLNDIIFVKSNSWGPEDTADIVEAPGPLTLAALQNAATTGRGGKGTLIFWAGGNGGDVNDNSNYDGYANSIYTIAIGATDSTGARSWYSEPGANLVVCAPSSGDVLGITTVDRTGTAGYNTATTANGGDYANDFGGTSSACPTAAGIGALMLEKNPNLGWRDVQEILIRSAYKFKPADTGWSNNSAGLHFHHDFGAGLIDAAAAVAMASTWTNLPAQTSAVSTQSGLSVAIPDNNTTGITRTFDLSASNIRVEHATIRLTINHTSRGNLNISLVSPSGMVSQLTEVHTDANDNFSDWTFSSVRHWGELSTGTWTLKISDRSTSSNSTGGTLTAAELKLFGTTAAPVNPAPQVAITSPAPDTVFGPGATVNVTVTATDLTDSGAPGTVTGVELFDNNVSVGTDTSAPYQFVLTPSLGVHTLVAKATDSENAVGTSVSVGISLVNQSPVVSAAPLSHTGQAYDDETLTVTSVSASDPENETLSYAYQWESSANGTAFTADPSATAASLPAAPARSAKLWRCVVTASDGTSASQPFTTAAVNLLARPTLTAIAGQSYTYASGLVLRGTESALSRAAIINEFSQGSGTAEWVEILTLQAASLRGWTLADSSTGRLTFADTAAWDAIPAGTLIVIYNGAAKDTLLPADDADPAGGSMIVSSSNTALFAGTTPTWQSLGNSGDAVVLRDATGTAISQLCYGTTSAYPPNIGSVGSGKSAYYTGGDDSGSTSAANWTITTSTVARSPKALLPGVVLTGGTYGQNFNTTPGATGTAYPDGWTAYNNATEDTAMAVGTSASTAGANYNYGSRIGLLGSSSAFDTSSLVLAIQNTTGLTDLTISYAVTKIREQGRSHDFKLQYSLTSPTTGFVDIPGGIYTSGTIAEGTTTAFSGIALPAELSDRSAVFYLRWLYTPNSTPGSGSRDGLALDDVVIGTTAAPTPTLALSAAQTTFAENAGAVTGTVSVNVAPAADLTVTLASSDPAAATVPASVTILAGQTSATFAITPVDDSEIDGSQSAALTATADGYINGTLNLTVTDNEAPPVGVTPGSPNSPQNTAFVSDLRSGALNSPALFRFGTGANVPSGLTLDPATGALTGAIAFATPAGTYPIIIERYNTLGETVCQSFTLTVEAGSAASYAGWIAGYPVGQATGPTADPDADGLANAIECLLGTRPDQTNTGVKTVSAVPGTLVFRHPRTNTPPTDLTLAYEWSADLATWHPAGTASGTTVTFGQQVIENTEAPATDLIEVTATATGTVPAGLFVRLAAVPAP